VHQTTDGVIPWLIAVAFLKLSINIAEFIRAVIHITTLATVTQFLVIKRVLASLAHKYTTVVVISDALSKYCHGNHVWNFS